MSKNTTILALVVVALVMFAAGWFAGRTTLERSWSDPVSVITAEDVKRASVEGADPTPAAGTRVLRVVPLRKMREHAKAFTEKDPVVMKVGTFGRDEEKRELHLYLHNRGDCKTKRVAGVVYGYDAWGRAVRVNKGGESYLAFDIGKDAEIEPGESSSVAMAVKDPSNASLTVAHVDLVECENGKTWKRQ